MNKPKPVTDTYERKIAKKLNRKISNHACGVSIDDCEIIDWIEKALIEAREKALREVIDIMEKSYESWDFHRGFEEMQERIVNLLPSRKKEKK